VIIPVRNEAAYIADQLAALAEQTYQGAWELVVVDNGCRDGTIEIVEQWRERLPAVQIVDARGRRRGLNHARNRGAAAARGELLCFCDGDDVVSSGWLRAHVEAARAADIVSGCGDHELLNDAAQKSWRPVEPQLELHRHPGYLTYASGGNCAIWADVAAELSWDERFRFGGSDQEFSFRAQLASRRIVFAPDAVIHLRHRSSLLGLLRQYYAYGKSGPQLYRAFRGHGMPPANREEMAGWGWLIRRSVYCFRHSPRKRIHWLRHAALSLGRLAGSIRWRVLYL
jgi:glycosyltransferase involved in cell wall biosynthesis